MSDSFRSDHNCDLSSFESGLNNSNSNGNQKNRNIAKNSADISSDEIVFDPSDLPLPMDSKITLELWNKYDKDRPSSSPQSNSQNEHAHNTSANNNISNASENMNNNNESSANDIQKPHCSYTNNAAAVEEEQYDAKNNLDLKYLQSILHLHFPGDSQSVRNNIFE